MAAFREVAAFAQFGSDLDKATQAQLARGQRLQEILKQPQYQPLDLEKQVCVLFAGAQGFADQVPVDRMKEWEAALIRTLETSHAEILGAIADQMLISPETEASLRKALEAFQRAWTV
jgi:F-type H+-transporting ATPase subunit alpha